MKAFVGDNQHLAWNAKTIASRVAKEIGVMCMFHQLLIVNDLWHSVPPRDFRVPLWANPLQ